MNSMTSLDVSASSSATVVLEVVVAVVALETCSIKVTDAKIKVKHNNNN